MQAAATYDNITLMDCLRTGDTTGLVFALRNSVAGRTSRVLDNQTLLLAEQKALDNVVRFLFSHTVDQHVRDEALREAIMHGDIVLIRLLLEDGADVHFHDDEALRKATARGDIAIIRLLLKYKANVHAYNDDALRNAAICGNDTIVRLLLEHGADVHVLDETPLSCAIFTEDVKCVTLLLNYGADPTVLSEEDQEKLSLLIGDGEGDTKPPKNDFFI